MYLFHIRQSKGLNPALPNLGSSNQWVKGYKGGSRSNSIASERGLKSGEGGSAPRWSEETDSSLDSEVGSFVS